MSDKVRVDKWLWSVRLYKSRTLAADACKSGKIRINQVLAKAASNIAVGDLIELKRKGFTFTFKVEKIIKTRVSAVLALPCYLNLTPEEELNKYKNWFVGKTGTEFREKGLGRPTKRERRDLDDFKIDSFNLADYWEEE